MLHSASLQNLTELLQHSPFFGSLPQGAMPLGCLSRVENIDISEVGPQTDFSWILGRFGFPEGPLGSKAPEESRRKIEQHRPQIDQRTTPGQEQPDARQHP